MHSGEKKHLSCSFSVTIRRKVLHKVLSVGFPGGPEVKTLNLHFRRCGWIPGQESFTCPGVWPREKKKKNPTQPLRLPHQEINK